MYKIVARILLRLKIMCNINRSEQKQLIAVKMKRNIQSEYAINRY